MTDTNIAGATAITGDPMDGMEEVTIIASIATVITGAEKRDTPALTVPPLGVMRTMGNTREIEVITISRWSERNSATYATPEKTCSKAAANYGVTSKS
jgi:hypothetical protein